jgi:hypothetical protein
MTMNTETNGQPAATIAKQPTHRIEIASAEWRSQKPDWPSGLRSAEDAARDLCISGERLASLADGGFAPHYRIDGGPPQFRTGELKRWAADYLIERIEGRDLPSPIRVIVSPPQVQDFRKVPTHLREIVGLCDITDEIMRTGIYFLCRDGALLYVGQSVNAASRVAEHYKRYELDTVFFLPWPGDDLNRLEAALIRALRPPLNGKGPNGTMRTSSGEKAGDAVLIASITNPPPQEHIVVESEPAGTEVA